MATVWSNASLSILIEVAELSGLCNLKIVEDGLCYSEIFGEYFQYEILLDNDSSFTLNEALERMKTELDEFLFVSSLLSDSLGLDRK